MASSRIQKFLSTAYSYYSKGTKESGGANRYKAGTPLAEIFGIFGAAPGTMWCAIFVYACAYKAGMTPALLKKDSSTSYAAGICYNVVAKGGKWIPGPYKTRSAVRPQPGDLILYNNSKYHMTYAANGKVTGWHGSHVGIVYSVEGSQVITIEGNVSNKVSKVTHKLNDSSIGGYARPKWSSTDLSYLGTTNQSLTQLYKIKNDRHDMTMRQVGYLDGSFNPTDTSTGLALSVINYTSVLGDLYEMFAPAQPDSKVNVSTDKLSGNAKIAMDYFLKMECTATAAAALTGCLQAYSLIDPNYFHFVQNTALYGIAAWDIIRLNEVKQWLGEDWNTNLSGQLEFFLHDIETNFNYIVQTLKTQELGKDNVENVIDIFMPVYNTKRNSGNFITLAKSFALDIYNKLVITKPQIIGNSTKITNHSGNQLTAKKSVTVPSSVSQTGIIDEYTSYSAFYTRWAAGSKQKELSRKWSSQGYPCNKGIATIGGYYCVAVSPKFGKCGDVIVVNLSGNISFTAIICDVKGADAKSEWGHKKTNGKISLIEWERVKTKNGKVITGTKFADVDSCGFKSWLGKKVVSIVNYGQY